MDLQTQDIQRLERYRPDTTEYTLAIITDEDLASQVTLEDGQVAWKSTLRYDRLHRVIDAESGRVRYEFKEIPQQQGGINSLISLVAEGGRGAEFSELVQFGNRLIAFDDRTGLVCEVRRGHALIPRQILMTGSGDEQFKGFKSEWATLKGDQLIVGSHGKVGIDNGTICTGPEEWVKIIHPDYRVQSVNWHKVYQAMREALDIDAKEGYLIHEAADWHPYYKEWYFFPRKISYEPFDEPIDERERGGNTLLIADESFSHIRTMNVGERILDRGVSSLKFIPGHPDECVALKSVERDEITETYAFCFDLDGNMLSEEIFLGPYKCEGVEII